MTYISTCKFVVSVYRFAGRYGHTWIEEIIGRGSFAEVHKGRWKEQEVALKRMRLPPGSDPSIVPKEVAVLG